MTTLSLHFIKSHPLRDFIGDNKFLGFSRFNGFFCLRLSYLPALLGSIALFKPYLFEFERLGQRELRHTHFAIVNDIAFVDVSFTGDK